MHMPVVYIAGPFRAPTAWDVECNIRRAEAVALDVWRMGAAALCPHTNTRFYNGAADDRLFLEGTLEFMRRCNAVLVCAGWQTSKGSIAEIEEAGAKGIPVFYAYNDLAGWINEYMRKQYEAETVARELAGKPHEETPAPVEPPAPRRKAKRTRKTAAKPSSDNGAKLAEVGL